MPQIRFQVGVPRAGSAARSAEDVLPVQSSLGSFAGSAARAAEAARQARYNNVTATPAIRMRAQGGQVSNQSAAQILTSQYAKQVDAMTAPSFASLPAFPSTAVRTVQPVEGEVSSGVLQIAAIRVQTLLRSLFSSGDRTS